MRSAYYLNIRVISYSRLKALFRLQENGKHLCLNRWVKVIFKKVPEVEQSAFRHFFVILQNIEIDQLNKLSDFRLTYLSFRSYHLSLVT